MSKNNLTKKEILQLKKELLTETEANIKKLQEQGDLLEELKTAQRMAEEINFFTAKASACYALNYLRTVLDKLIVDVEKFTVPQLQKLVGDGRLTYTTLTRIYLNRISMYNDAGIAINAVRMLNPQALQEAGDCDKRLAANPALAQGIFGMPILIKDNIETRGSDGMPTTAGSVAFANNFAADDAVIVKKLRAQGAVILGKTNLSEFANFITNGVRRADGSIEAMPSGYSTLGGQVLCPYKPGVINPAGSSSGSGAGCAAGFAALAIGTETSGSILNPATANSLVGIKPTVGLISRRGIIPLSHSQDTAGPMTRTVTDAAILLEAMKCFDEQDYPVTAGCNDELVTPEYWREHTEYYLACLRSDGLQGKRLGVYVQPDAVESPDLYAVFMSLLQQLKSLGAVIVFDENGKNMDEIAKRGRNELPWVSELLHLDFAKDIQSYLDGLSEHRISIAKTEIRNLHDIIAFNKCYPERLLYGQSILERCAEYDISPCSQDMQRAKIVHDEEIYWSRTQTLDKLFAKYNLDALISVNGGTTRIAAKAGYPSITVPAGYRDAAHDQYPINLQFTGQAFSEGNLLALAYAFEQYSKARRAPGMADKINLQEAISDALKIQYQGEELAEAVRICQSNFSTPADVHNAQQALWNALSAQD